MQSTSFMSQKNDTDIIIITLTLEIKAMTKEGKPCHRAVQLGSGVGGIEIQALPIPKSAPFTLELRVCLDHGPTRGLGTGTHFSWPDGLLRILKSLVRLPSLSTWFPLAPGSVLWV